MNTTERELLNKLLEAFKAWNQDLQAARDDYKESIKTLDKAREAIEKQAKSKAQLGLEYAPWIVLLLILIGIIIAFFTFKCGTVTYNEFSYAVPCPVKSP